MVSAQGGGRPADYQAADRARDGRRRLAAVATDAQRVRGRVRKLEERFHAADLAAGEIGHELSTLAGRIREDYGVELSELEQEVTGDEVRRRADVHRKSTPCVRKSILWATWISRPWRSSITGRAPRYAFGAIKDLSDAENALARIIVEKINADSRRLFIETLETVRGHFGELFEELVRRRAGRHRLGRRRGYSGRAASRSSPGRRARKRGASRS